MRSSDVNGVINSGEVSQKCFETVQERPISTYCQLQIVTYVTGQESRYYYSFLPEMTHLEAV